MPIAGEEGDDVELGLETAAELARVPPRGEDLAPQMSMPCGAGIPFALAAGCRAPDVEIANHGREHAAFADGLNLPFTKREDGLANASGKLAAVELFGIGVSVKAHGAERARRAAERGLDAGHVRARDEAWLGGDGAAGVVGRPNLPGVRHVVGIVVGPVLLRILGGRRVGARLR